MSWRASAYVKKLRVAPNGEPLSKDEKLVLLHLADAHNDDKGMAWPSIVTIASDCMISIRHAQDVLHEAERKGVLRIIRPEKNGRGRLLCYRFVELDAQDAKDARCAPFASTSKKPLQTCTEGTINRQITCTKDAQQCAPIKKEQGTKNRGTVDHHTSLRDAMTVTQNAALSAWLEAKELLRARLDPKEWNLWVRPAKLCKLLPDGHLLIALPPNNSILEAAKQRLPLLRSILGNQGYSASFTKYPDDYERERLRTEFPEFYSGMFGTKERE